MSNSGRASTFALQRIGKVTATLGEVAKRSELIIFWFCDPVKSHPRLLERLSRSSSPKRTIIVIDEAETQTANVADKFIQISANQGISLLATLRSKLAETKSQTLKDIEKTTGLLSKEIDELFDLISKSNFGSIFYGQPESDSEFDIATQSIHSLVRKLNDVTRFVGLKLRHDGNSQSAENVLGWSTGYPMAVSHSLGFPRFNWLEHSAESVLNRGECDAILFATGADLLESLEGLSRTARNHLGSIPKIALSPISNFPSDIAFQIGLLAITDSGEVCRFDDVSLPAKGLELGDSAESILKQLEASI